MKEKNEKLSENNNDAHTLQNKLLDDLKEELKNSIEKTSEIFDSLLADIDKTVNDEETYSSTLGVIKNISIEFKKISSLAQDELRDVYSKNKKFEEE